MQNQIPKNWQELKFGDVATLHRGYDLPMEKMTAGNYPVIFSNGKTEYHNQYKIKGPGVITGRSGSLGNTFYIDEDFWPHNTTLYVSDFHGNNPKFVYYLLKTLNFSFLNAGSGVPTLNRNHVHEIPLKVPIDPEVQNQIASILSAFDYKIELNNKISKTLEEMAQLLFKEWFINFNPPGGISKIIDSEFGVIPEGWKIERLGKIIDNIVDNRGKTPLIIEKNNWAIPLIEVNALVGENRIVDISQCKKFVDQTTYDNWFRKGHPKTGNVLVSTVGSVGELAQIFDEKISIAQNIIALRHEGFGNYLYQLLKSIQNKIKSMDISSTQPSLKVPHLLDLKIIEPETELKIRFEKAISPIVNKIYQNTIQTNNLIALRDLLLPRLMKGEIRV